MRNQIKSLSSVRDAGAKDYSLDYSNAALRGMFFVGQAGPPTWVLKANLARIHSEPVPASAAMPRARDAHGTQSYFFLEALAFLWRSLISRRAASRAAARTSVFSVRFLVMACCGKETGKGQHAGRVGLYVGGVVCFLSPRCHCDACVRTWVCKPRGMDESSARTGAGRTSREAPTRERLPVLIVRFFLRATTMLVSCWDDGGGAREVSDRTAGRKP